MRHTCMLFPELTFHKTEGETPEDALKAMQNVIGQPLTYRPADGAVYINYSHIPRGVVFKAT